MSWAEISPRRYRVLKALFAGLLAKGAHHKYLKRVPTGKTSKSGKPLYRYFYKVSGGVGSVLHEAHLRTAGAAFKVGDAGGHIHIEDVHDDGHVTLRHDESGRVERVHVDALKGRIVSAHGVAQEAHDAAAKARRAAELAAAEKHGTPKQKETARKRAKAAGLDEPPARAPRTISWGQNYHAAQSSEPPASVGDVIEVNGGHVVPTRFHKRYIREDGLSFGLADDSGWYHTADARWATPGEIAKYEAEKARRANSVAEKKSAADAQNEAYLKASKDAIAGKVRVDGAGHKIQDRREAAKRSDGSSSVYLGTFEGHPAASITWNGMDDFRDDLWVPQEVADRLHAEQAEKLGITKESALQYVEKYGPLNTYGSGVYQHVLRDDPDALAAALSRHETAKQEREEKIRAEREERARKQAAQREEQERAYDEMMRRERERQAKEEAEAAAELKAGADAVEPLDKLHDLEQKPSDVRDASGYMGAYVAMERKGGVWSERVDLIGRHYKSKMPWKRVAQLRDEGREVAIFKESDARGLNPPKPAPKPAASPAAPAPAAVPTAERTPEQVARDFGIKATPVGRGDVHVSGNTFANKEHLKRHGARADEDANGRFVWRMKADKFEAAMRQAHKLQKGGGWVPISRAAWRSLRDQIAKGAHHKYLKRVPTGKVSKTGKPLYRYFYKPAGGSGSVLHDAHLSTVGAGFKVGDANGHAHIEAVHGDGHVTLRHDETGRTERVHVSELRRRVEAAHGAAQGAHDAAAKARRAAELAAAEKHGSPKQKEAARKRAGVSPKDVAVAKANKRQAELGLEGPERMEPLTGPQIKATVDLEVDDLESKVVHEEVGVHVIGARRDYAVRGERTSRADSLKKAGKVTKAEVFGRKTILEHVGNGGTVGGWHCRQWVAGFIAPAPPAGGDLDDAYIEGCTLVSKTLDRCKTPADVETALREIEDWVVKSVPIKHDEQIRREWQAQTLGIKVSWDDLAPPGTRYLGRAYHSSLGRVAQFVPVAALALGERFLKMIFKPSDARRDAMRKGRNLDRTGVDAQSYAELHAARAGFTLDSARQVPEARRSGGRDIPGVTTGRVTGEQVAARFGGIKNIDYGEWMTNDDRDQHLRAAGGAMADLADLLGVDDGSLSIGGRLAIGFGARGRGGLKAAAAHYESFGQVINLTKFRGGGTLAHEFGHFLDHVSVGSPQLLKEHATGMYGSTNHDGLPPASRKAMQELSAALYPSAFVMHAHALDKERKSGYWSSSPELFARLFESWAEDSLSAGGKQSTYLVHGTQKMHPTGVEIAAPVVQSAATRAASDAYKDAHAAMRQAILDAVPVHAPQAKTGQMTRWGVSDNVFVKLMARSPEVKAAVKNHDDAVRALTAATRADQAAAGKVSAQPYPQGEERVRLVGLMKNVVDAMRADGILGKIAKAFFRGTGKRGL